jgi:chemotaxis protein MotB
MQRRAPRVGADRWLVSYADFTTLLLAFFMALYTVSEVDQAKLAAATSSLRAAFDTPEAARSENNVPIPATNTSPTVDPAGSSDTAKVDAMAAVRERIEQELAGAITAGQLEIGADDRGLVLSLPERATFPVASADVTSDAQAVIDRVATTLESLDVAVRIEGHTDDTPIRTARYASNWELSTARASAVVARFIQQRMDPRRLSAAGYSQFHPRATNDTPAGRASNRRVDVVVIPPAADETVTQTALAGRSLRDSQAEPRQ